MENNECRANIFCYKSSMQLNKQMELKSMQETLKSQLNEKLIKAELLSKECFETNQECDDQLQSGIVTKEYIKVFDNIDKIADSVKTKKRISKNSLSNLLLTERRITELEKKLPFIYDCMGNTLFGNKYMEIRDLKQKIGEKEKAEAEIEAYLESLELEVSKDDFLEEYRLLTSEIQKIREENETHDRELKIIVQRMNTNKN